MDRILGSIAVWMASAIMFLYVLAVFVLTVTVVGHWIVGALT